MAHTKSAGATKLGRDSRPKYLGIKKFGGQKVSSGQILIRQRGLKWWPGQGVKRGSDDTLYSLRDGIVKFSSKTRTKFDGNKRKVKIISVV